MSFPKISLPAKTDPQSRELLLALKDATAIRSSQAVAANSTEYHLPPLGAENPPIERARRLDRFEATLLVACAAGESLVYTISRRREGVDELVGTVTVDADTGTFVAAALSDILEFEAGDLVKLVRNYTAGGGPAASVNIVRLTWK